MCPPMLKSAYNGIKAVGRSISSVVESPLPKGSSVRPARWKVPGVGLRNDFYGLKLKIPL